MKQPPRLSLLKPRVGSLGRLAGADKKALPFYSSPAWKQLIAAIIKARGRGCEDPSCTTPNRGAGQRVYGDHVHELQDGGAPLDPGNVMLRCAPCHGRKTAAAARER